MKIGDVVKLKSGGPLLTVTVVYGENTALPNHVQVSWFDEKQIGQDAVFPIEALNTVELTQNR